MAENSCRVCEAESQIPAANRVYDDEEVLVFMDKHPINPGHMLVIPRQHLESFYQLEEPAYSGLMGVLNGVSGVWRGVAACLGWQRRPQGCRRPMRSCCYRGRCSAA